MKKKVIRLTESDIESLVKKIIKEDESPKGHDGILYQFNKESKDKDYVAFVNWLESNGYEITKRNDFSWTD